MLFHLFFWAATLAVAVQQESYRDIIQKAQNLSLQRERQQTSQLLLRALIKEPKGSPAHRELLKSLQNLMSVHYTDKAQGTFALAESLVEMRPREALEHYTESLRIEDGNILVLQALARAQLRLGDCDAAESALKRSDVMNPYTTTGKLLHLQVLDCKKEPRLAEKIALAIPELEEQARHVHSMQMKELYAKKDFRRMKILLATWEASVPEMPEVDFWKWQISVAQGQADHAAAKRYFQSCQNLSAKKRKTFNLDVDLCKGRERVEQFLKQGNEQQSEGSTS